MTDTVDDVDLPYDEEASTQDKLETLQERLEILEAQNEEMRDELCRWRHLSHGVPPRRLSGHARL